MHTLSLSVVSVFARVCVCVCAFVCFMSLRFQSWVYLNDKGPRIPCLLASVTMLADPLVKRI